MLTINLTNLKAVTFTGTGVAASPSNDDYTYYDGIDLGNFFRANPGGGFPSSVSGTLGVSGEGIYYNYFAPDYSASNGLNIFKDESASYQLFGSLSGTITLNLSAFAADLPTAGSSGTLYAGYPGNETAIGAWEAISTTPEPQVSLYALLGVAALLLRRRLGVFRGSK